METRIRAAYWSLADEPNEWVSLTVLRPLLGDVPKEDVDAVLARMERTPSVNIAEEPNQKTLLPEDREAAVRIGGRDKHLLAIEDR